MPAQGSVTNTTGYVNYIYNISSRGTAQVASQLLGLSGIAGNILGQIAFQTSSYLNTTEGALLSLGVVATAGLTKATEFAMKFNQEMETVHAISGKTVTTLADNAMEMSNKFGVALGDMTKGLEALARAGVSTGNMTAILEQAMGLSKLEGLPLEKSINALISTTNLLDTTNLDLESPEYAEAVKYQTQKITATSEAAPINANDIIHTLEHVGGYASSTKLDQDDLYAVIAQLGSKGTKSEMAGTSLRAFLAAGQKDTAQRALKRIGLEVKDLWKDDETIMSISDMKDVLDEAMEARGYTQQEKLEFYSDFAGYKQANQIMKIDTDSVREFKDKIDRSWATSKKMETVLNTAQTNLQSMMQTGVNFLTKVGEPLLPIVSIVAKTVKTIIDIVDAIPGSNLVIAGGLLLVSVKSISTIFNKIGPQLLSHMNFSLSIKEFWDDTRESLKESYDIIKKMGDNKELLKKELKIESERIDDNDKIRYIREELGFDVQDAVDVRRYEQTYGILDDKRVSKWKDRELLSEIAKIPKEKREKESNRERNKRANYTDPTVKAINNMQESFEELIDTFKQTSPTSQFKMDEHLRSQMITAFKSLDDIKVDVNKIREILENGGGGGGPSRRGGPPGGFKKTLRRSRDITHVDPNVRVIPPERPKITRNQIYETRVQDFAHLSSAQQSKVVDDYETRKEYRNKISKEKETRRRERVAERKDEIIVVQSRTPDLTYPRIADLDFSRIKDVAMRNGRPDIDSLKDAIKIHVAADTSTQEGKAINKFFEEIFTAQLENKIQTGFKFQGKSIPLLVSDIEKAFSADNQIKRLETIVSAHLPRLLRGDDSRNMYTSDNVYKPYMVSVPWERKGKKFETREKEYIRRKKFLKDHRMTDDFTTTEIDKFFKLLRDKEKGGIGFDTTSLNSEFINERGGWKNAAKIDKIGVINQIMPLITDENDLKKIRRFWTKTIDFEEPDEALKGLTKEELFAIRDQYRPIKTESQEFKKTKAADIIRDIQQNVAKRAKHASQLEEIPLRDEYMDNLEELYRSPIAWLYSQYYDYKKPTLDPVTKRHMDRLKQNNPEQYKIHKAMQDASFEAEKERRLRYIEGFNQKYGLNYGNKFANLIALRNQLQDRGGLYNDEVKEELKAMAGMVEVTGTTKYDPDTGKLKPNSQSKKDANIQPGILRAKIMHGDSGVHGLWEWAGAVAEDLINLWYQTNGYDPDDLPYEMQRVIVPINRKQAENIIDEAIDIIDAKKYRHTEDDREYGTSSNRWSDFILVGSNYRKGQMSRTKRNRAQAYGEIASMSPGQMRSHIYGDDVVGPHRKKRMADLEPMLINSTIIDDETGEEEVRTVIGYRRVGKNFSPDPRIYDPHQQDLRKMQAEAVDAEFTVKTPKSKEEQFEDYNKERLKETPGLKDAVEEARKRANYVSEIGEGPGDHVHHLNAYNFDYLGRADPANLMLLSEYIHNLFHDIYGRGENTKDQMLEFLLNHFPAQAGRFMLTRGASGLSKEQLVLSQKEYWDEETKAKQDWWLNAPPESMSYLPTHDYDILEYMPYSSFFDRVVQVPFLSQAKDGKIKYDTFTMLNSDPHIIALYKAISDAQQAGYANKTDEELRKILISRHITEARYGLKDMPKFDKEKGDWVGYDELKGEQLLNLLRMSHEAGLNHLMLNVDHSLRQRSDFVPNFGIANKNYKMWENADISVVGLRHQDLWKEGMTPQVGDQVYFAMDNGVLGAYTQDGKRIGVFPQSDEKIQELQDIHAPILTNQSMRNTPIINRTGTITGALDGRFAFIKINPEEEDIYDLSKIGQVGREILGGRQVDMRTLNEMPAAAIASDPNGTHKSFVTPEETIKRNKEEIAKRHKILEAALFEQYGFLPEHYAELTEDQKKRALERYLAQDFVDPTHYIKKHGREAWKDKQARMNIEIENQSADSGQTFRFKPFRRKLSDTEYYDLLLKDAEYQRTVLGRNVDPDSANYKPELFQHLGEYLGEHQIIDYDLAHYSLEDMQKIVQLEDVINYVQLLNTRTPSKSVTVAQKKGLNYGKKKNIDLPLTYGETLDAILRGDQNPLRVMRALLIQNPNNIPNMIQEIQETLEHRVGQYNEFVEKYGDMSQQMFALVDNQEQIIASDIFHGDVMGEPIDDAILGNMEIIENINSQLANYEDHDDVSIVSKGELQLPIKDFENLEPLRKAIESLTDEGNNIIQQLQTYASQSSQGDQLADFIGLFTTITILTDMLNDLTSKRFLNILDLPLYQNAISKQDKNNAIDYDIIMASIENLKNALTEVEKMVPDAVQKERKGNVSHWHKSTWDNNVVSKNTSKGFSIDSLARYAPRADLLDRFDANSEQVLERANRMALLELFADNGEDIASMNTTITHKSPNEANWGVLGKIKDDENLTIDLINFEADANQGGFIVSKFDSPIEKKHFQVLKKKYGFDLNKLKPIDKKDLIESNIDNYHFGNKDRIYQYIDEDGQSYYISQEIKYKQHKDLLSEEFKRAFILGPDVFGDDVHKVVDDRVVGPYTKFLPINKPSTIVKTGKREGATGSGPPPHYFKRKKPDTDTIAEAIRTGTLLLSSEHKDKKTGKLIVDDRFKNVIINKQLEKLKNQIVHQIERQHFSTEIASFYRQYSKDFRTDKRLIDEINFGHLDDDIISHFGLAKNLQGDMRSAHTRPTYLSDLDLSWSDIDKFREHFKGQLFGRDRTNFLRMTAKVGPRQLKLTDEYKKFIMEELGYKKDIPNNIITVAARKRPVHLNDVDHWEDYVPDLLAEHERSKKIDLRKKKKSTEDLYKDDLLDYIEIAKIVESPTKSLTRLMSHTYKGQKAFSSTYQDLFNYTLKEGQAKGYAAVNPVKKYMKFNIPRILKEFNDPKLAAEFLVQSLVHESSHVIGAHYGRSKPSVRKKSPGLYIDDEGKYEEDPGELEAFMIQGKIAKALGFDMTKITKMTKDHIDGVKASGRQTMVRQDVVDSVSKVILNNLSDILDFFTQNIDLSSYDEEFQDAVADLFYDLHSIDKEYGLNDSTKFKEIIKLDGVDNNFINAMNAIPMNERDLLRINLKNDLRLSKDDYHYSDYLKDVNDFGDLPYVPPVSRWNQDQDAKNKVRQMIAQDNQRMLERSQRDELMQNLKVQAGLGTVGARTYRRVRNAQPIEGFESGLEQIANNFVNDLLQYSPNANMQGASDLARLNDALQLHGSRLEGISLYLEQVSTWLPIITPALLAIQGILQVQAAVSTGIGQITDFMGLSGRMRETFAKGGVYALEGIHGANEGLTADSNIAKLLMASSDTFSAAMSAISTALIPILPYLIAIAGAFIVVGKALDWSRQSHQKYLKSLEEEQKEVRSRSKALRATAEDAKELARKNRAPKQQAALDRNARLAQQRLDNANMSRAATAIDLTRARNDTLWGEYGISAGINKLTGKYESTADNYDGTSKEIRKIKEATLANPFASDAMRQVSAYYDANQLAFGQMDEYKEELGELYDTETGIMKKVGPGRNARETPEFQRALDKFVEATGITRDHAQKYLDYMQTEHNVDKATQAMQAQADSISAQTEMKIQAIKFGGNPADVLGLNGIEAQQSAMVKAQGDMIKAELTGQLWWKAVWATITAPVKLIISPIFAIANLLGAIWAFMTGNWSDAWDKAGKAAGSFNVFNEAATYWGAWGEAESTDFNTIGQGAVDDRNRRNYGNATASASSGGYHNTPQVPTGHYGWGGQIFVRDNGDQSQWQHASRTNGQSVSVVSQGTGTIVSLLGTIITILTTGLLLGGVYKGFKHFGGDISKDGIKESLQSLLSMSKEDLIQKGKDGLSGAWDLLRGRKHIKGRAKNAYYGYRNKKAYMDNYEDPMEAYIAAMNGEEYDPTAWRESDNPWIRFGQRKIKSIKQLPQKISDRYVSPWKEYIGKQMGLSEDYTFDDYLADKKTSISENYIAPWKEYAQNKIQSKVQSTYGTLKAKAELYRNPNLGGRFTNVDDSWSVRMMAKGMDLKDKYLGNVGLDGLSLDTLQDPEKLIAFAKEKLAGAEEGTYLATIRNKLQKGDELLQDPEAMHAFLKERYGDQYNKAQELLQDPEAMESWVRGKATGLRHKFENYQNMRKMAKYDEANKQAYLDSYEDPMEAYIDFVNNELNQEGIKAKLKSFKESILGWFEDDATGEISIKDKFKSLKDKIMNLFGGDDGDEGGSGGMLSNAKEFISSLFKRGKEEVKEEAEEEAKEPSSIREIFSKMHDLDKDEIRNEREANKQTAKDILTGKAFDLGTEIEDPETLQSLMNSGLGNMKSSILPSGMSFVEGDPGAADSDVSILDFVDDDTVKHGGKLASKAGKWLSGKGGKFGKAGKFLTNIGSKIGSVGEGGGFLSSLLGGGEAAAGVAGAAEGGGILASLGIGAGAAEGGILAGALGGGAAAGGVAAAEGGALLAAEGGLAATGVGLPVAAALAIGSLLLPGILDGAGKAIGGIFGGVKKALGFGGYNNTGRNRGSILGGLTPSPILGMLGGVIGLGGMVAGGIGGMLGGMLGMGKGVKGGGMLKNTGVGVFGLIAGSLNTIVGKHDKNIELNEKQNKAMNRVADKVGNSNNSSSSSGGNITIQNININTDDDPEAIKAMFLDLIVELQEQVNPRLVSRTTGSSNTSTSDSSTQSETEQSQQQSGTNPGGQGLGGH